MSISARRRAAATVAALTLGLGIAPLASPAHAAADPCATQQTQLDRAVATKASLDARMQALATRVKEARAEVRGSDTAKERRAARKELRAATSRRAEVGSARKAQVQRIAKAQSRLDACRAKNPVVPETPAP